MSGMKLFRYTVILHDPKDSTKDKVVVPTAEVLASSESNARLRATRAIPVDAVPDDQLDNVEVVVSPF